MRIAISIVAFCIALAFTAYFTWWGPRQAPASQFEVTGSIQDLMEGLIEPNADAIFESVAIVSTAAGTEERRPRTDAEWARVERAALTLAEAANLLRIPGRAVARPGAPAQPASAAVPELTPEQIHEKMQATPDVWQKHTAELIQQSRRALEFARTRNVEGLFMIGGDLDAVCENCHLVYWYPNAPEGTRSQ